MPGKRTTDAMFALGMLMEKYKEGQREVHCIFMDAEKATIGFREKSCGTV